MGIGPAIDRQHVEALTCIECEQGKVQYEPWIGRGHYVVLAVCACGWIERRG